MHSSIVKPRAVAVAAAVLILAGCASTSSPTADVADESLLPVAPSLEVGTNDGADQGNSGGVAAGESPGQENARRAAENYIGIMAFSRSGLIDQLKFEGYSVADATYGVDTLGVNWNEQAVKKAQEYLDLMPFSRTGLIDQLKFDGFSASEAQFGVSQAGL